MASYNVVVSVVVHFETYRNVDLLHQGLYFLRARLHTEKRCSPALPLDIYSVPNTKRPKKNKFDFHDVAPAYSDDLTFSTRTFAVRYCEEEVELNDACEFRIEFPVTPQYFLENCIMEVQLYFGELLKIGGIEKLSQCAEKVKDLIEFKVVSTQKFAVRGVARGISQYVQVHNDSPYTSICNMTIHSTLIDFRYRIISIEELLALRKAKVDPAKALAERDYSQKSLARFLFANADGSMPCQVKHSEVDQIYTDYVNALARSHEGVKERFMEIQTRCLNERQRIENAAALKCQDLIFPGDKNEDQMFSLQEVINDTSREEQSKVNEEQHETGSECDITNEISQLENYKKLSMEPRREEVSKLVDETFGGDTDEKASKNIIVPSFRPNHKLVFKGQEAAELKTTHSLRAESQDPSKCAAKFAFNVTLVSGQVIELWQKYIELLMMTPRFVTEMLYIDYLKFVTTQKYL